MRFYRRIALIGIASFIIPALLLVSCRAGSTLPPPASTPNQPAPTQTLATFTPAPTPTAEKRSLVICLGQEPLTLYPYGAGSATQWSVLEAVYDGPIDTLGVSGSQPVILQKLPSLADQDAVLQPAPVTAGDTVVDTNGDLTTLNQGVKVFPSGCTSAGCAVTYDGKSDLQMDQLKVTFKLLPGVTWSDGTPVKASDSVYSYHLAANKDTPVSKSLVDRTAAYQTIDDATVQWTGVPGYTDPAYPTFFWMPLPEHAWGAISPLDLQTAEISAMKPMGWGPYIIDEWTHGDHITLSKNPNYFRVKEGLPKFDTLVFRFIGQNSNANINALLVKECDLVDQTGELAAQAQSLTELEKAGKLKTYFAAGPEWEHLDFGIKPASYDDGYNPAAGDRPDFFGDVRVRQAVAYCADRQGLVDRLLLKQSQVPSSYIPPDDPRYDAAVKSYAFDPAAGIKLLEAAGWKDPDNNPATPRVAQGVAGVPAGTAFSVTYLTTQAALRDSVAKALQASLAQCGLQVKIREIAPDELFAPGPDGLLFGRQFDLAAFSWQAGTRAACFLYQSGRVPTAQNHWVGENITGYANPAYDQACQAALSALPGSDAAQQAHQQAQQIFAEDLPSLPLYLELSLDGSRPDFCGFRLVPGGRSDLWGIESYDYGASCPG